MSKQLTVEELINQLQAFDKKLPVYFRRISPITGNIEEACSAELSNVGSFGIVEPCVIIEPDNGN